MSEASAQVDPAVRRRAARAAFVGTVLEYYDFSLYGSAAATVFAQVFFPGASPFLGTLQSVATFAVAFLVRPFGGAILGSIGDRIGRQRVLIGTMLVMGLATMAIGLVPGYATIGWAAPVLLVLCRLLQGIGASAEFGGATLVAVEFARPGRRGLFGSLPGTGAGLGGVLGTLMLLAASAVSGPAFLEWGWRIPFLLSGVLVGYGIWLRLRLPETPAFRRVEGAGETTRTPLRDLVRKHPREVVAIIAIVTAQTGFGYFYLVFVVSYASGQVGMSQSQTFAGLLAAQLSGTLLTPVFGALSDRFGRPALILFGLVASAAMAFPLFALIRADFPPGLWIAMILANGVAASAIVATAGTLVTELFGPGIRFSGMGLARETGNMIGAAAVPLLAVQLAYLDAGTWPMSVLLLALSAVGLLGLLAVRTRVRRTDDVPEAARV
ncbi:MFS transporter [Pseudonocardia endophytica]|uniref:Putative MFS family arabinose efflux permease n=1 Tax=Pseudonocardia endophytica TaxID=401976 RepID=A0A4R1HWS3_PSEEN|nr:MFS transporter [Pseudonocardia endophytica]TCK21992.1 putative MFS family arabinose efflux permease [Pseudonocardia endophytica]